MKVRMKVKITGTRNGVDWPSRGDVLDVPDWEGAQLCANRYAEPVVVDDVETATTPEPESRPRARTRKES